MLRVFLTVDIEVWPSRSDWQENGIGTDLEHCVYGVTPEGRYGLEYQLDVLNRYGLKAVCFVEPLFAHTVGFEHLQGIVDAIRKRGHEVQLHIHTEWLRVTDQPALPLGTDRTNPHMKDYDADVQELLVRHGLELLGRCGVPPPCAFRAGNQAANLDTLRAVARVGLPFDSSYYVASRSECDLPGSGLLVQPACLEGVREFPITFFADWPGHHRPLQLCACSSAEIEGTLRKALREGCSAIVLLMHGVELVTRPRGEGGELLAKLAGDGAGAHGSSVRVVGAWGDGLTPARLGRSGGDGGPPGAGLGGRNRHIWPHICLSGERHGCCPRRHEDRHRYFPTR